MEGVMKVEGVTKGEGVIVVNSVEVGPEMIAMEGVNGVKYEDFQEELVPAEEYSTIAEIQVKDTAHNIDASNSCTRDCMMDLTGYDPGGGITDIITANDGVNMSVLSVNKVDAGHSEIDKDSKAITVAAVDKDKQEEACRFKRDYVREEERLRLKRNIAQISFGALGITDSTPHIVVDVWQEEGVYRRFIRDGKVRCKIVCGVCGRDECGKYLQVSYPGGGSMRILTSCNVMAVRVKPKQMIHSGTAGEEWFSYQGPFPMERRIWRRVCDTSFIIGTDQEGRTLQAKLPRYAAPQLGDLVLRRQSQVDKSLGMKLHAKWDGPYKLTRISKSGVSGNLEDLKTGKVIGRYAFESLKVYVPREQRCLEDGWVSLAEGLKAEDIYASGEVHLSFFLLPTVS